MMATKFYIMDEMCSLKKQKQAPQNSSKVDENIKQVSNGLRSHSVVLLKKLLKNF